jgi:transposase-like protein
MLCPARAWSQIWP